MLISVVRRPVKGTVQQKEVSYDQSWLGHLCVYLMYVFFLVQAKLEDDLPSETVSKVHLVDLAGR